jgi:tetratricopeptide (TPR) repeat protein
MRSAEGRWRGSVVIALALCASACAMLPATHRAGAEPAAVQSSGAAQKTPADGAVASTAPTAAGDALPAIPAEAQRAFAAAAQALAAGHIDEAERGFLALAKSNPDLGGPYANLGLIYRRAGKLEQAAQQLEQAVRASPKRAVYQNQLGITYREIGRFADAQRAYEKAIELEPEYAAPHLNLGILLDLYLWDSSGALAAYERYLALAGEGDGKVRKWVADLRNRVPRPQLAGVKERS